MISEQLIEDGLISLARKDAPETFSPDEIKAIQQPASLHGLATLIDVVDGAARNTIINLVDIDYLASNLILNRFQLGACLVLCPLLGPRLLSDDSFIAMIGIAWQLLQLIKIIRSSGVILLEAPSIRSLIDNGDQLIAILESAPECADALLNDPNMRALIKEYYQLKRIRKIAPQWADALPEIELPSLADALPSLRLVDP